MIARVIVAAAKTKPSSVALLASLASVAGAVCVAACAYVSQWPSANFEPGAIVALNSGGNQMTVVSSQGNMVSVVYMNNGQLTSATVPASACHGISD